MKRLIVLFCFLFTLFSFSQNEELDSLTIQLAFQNPDTTKVNTSLSIIKLLYKDRDYDKALKYIKQSEKLSENLNYSKGIAEISYYKALIYKEKSDYINALNQFIKSKNLFSRLKDTLSVAKIDSNLGVIEIERGNYKSGLSYALSGIKQLEKRQLYQELSSAYKSLATAYQNTNNYDKAIDFNLKSLKIVELTNDNGGLISANKNLADIYFQRKDYTKAVSYYESALNHIDGNNTELRADILPKLGGALIKTENYDLASDYLVEGIRLNRKTKNTEGVIIALNNLGELNLARKRIKTAEEQLLEAGSLGRAENNKQQLLKNYMLMKTLDSTKGNFESAFAWQREYYKIKNSIEESKSEIISERVEDTPILDELEALEETASENTVLAEAINEDLVSKEKLDKFKLIFYALLAAFAVVLVFFVLFYLKRNNRLKYTRELEEKNQKIELQNEAILEQSKHLESINKVKDKLFSIVSHDLKDSLTSTKGFIDLLKEGSLTQEEFHSLLPELSENANNASLLLFNLLNWSKSQMQSLEPKPSLFDIQEVFYDKVKLIEQKMQSKNVLLIDNTLRDFVYADRSMVEIILQNLLANAIKFCKSGDTITISNRISNGRAIISVADSGVGITKENQNKLFSNNTFTTVGTKNEKGTGLGLTICKELVELNKGRIWVDSTVNEGSTFYVELPKTRVEDPVNT